MTEKEQGEAGDRKEVEYKFDSEGRLPIFPCLWVFSSGDQNKEAVQMALPFTVINVDNDTDAIVGWKHTGTDHDDGRGLIYTMERCRLLVKRGHTSINVVY